MAAATLGAKIVSKHYQRLDQAAIENKHNGEEYRGIVTLADTEAEAAIVARIRDQFPTHDFLAEEAFADDSSAASKKHLWVIDPLDGTNNFAHGIPHFAVSVAYYRNGTADCGVIINPWTGDQFLALQGQGAYWGWQGSTSPYTDRENGQPQNVAREGLKQVFVNEHSALDQTMLAVGFYYDRGPMMRATLDAMEACFREHIHGIRRFGTAALDIVQVGLGRFGAFFEYELSPWDFGAARLFLEEAGGKITTCQGADLPLAKTSVLASNGLLHGQLLDIVSNHADY